MSKTQDRMKIAAQTAQGESTGTTVVVACRLRQGKDKTSTTTIAFEDSAENGKLAAAALDGNVNLNHDGKNMAYNNNNNFLHDNDFTFIDADDDSQSIGCNCTDNVSLAQQTTSSAAASPEDEQNADYDCDSAAVANTLGKSI